MIPIDRYNKDYDMFLRGNIGIGSEDAIIERIQNEDALYLIKKKGEGVNWQNPHKVTAYIRENMEYIGTKESNQHYIGIIQIYIHIRSTKQEEIV